MSTRDGQLVARHEAKFPVPPTSPAARSSPPAAPPRP
jgi:hypothetical protein